MKIEMQCPMCPKGTNRQSIYTARTPTYALRVPVHFCYSSSMVSCGEMRARPMAKANPASCDRCLRLGHRSPAQ